MIILSKKYKFVFLIFLGIIIQAASLYITFQIAPSGDGWFWGLGQILWYLCVGQWVGYIIQLVIAIKLTKKLSTAFKICAATIPIIYSMFYINANIQRMLNENEAQKSRIFVNEDILKSEIASGKYLKKRYPKITIKSPNYKLSCPSSFVISKESGVDFPKKYELLTLYFPANFERKGKYTIELSYTSNLNLKNNLTTPQKPKNFRKKAIINIQKSGDHIIKWTIHSNNLWGYFVKSGTSKIRADFTFNYSNYNIYSKNRINLKNDFNYTKQTSRLPHKLIHISGVANTRTRTFPNRLKCKSESTIELLK